ncbi:MAG: NAD-dependent epimerase/dehydratase family protein [bacterium]|nr:NAD-dependent epimerase/dehydratase family protein [bacterium]
MKVLITGMSGFIAPHIAEACLNIGWDVWGIDILNFNYKVIEYDFRNPHFKFEKRDVRSLAAEELKGVDYVFHLAFVTNITYDVQHPLETAKDNIDMTAYMLEMAKQAGIKKLVFPSTASAYGLNPTPWKEDMPLYPIETYSWQKLSGELALKTWSACYGLPTVSLRLFQVFGENQRPDTVIAVFSRLKKEGKPVTLMETSPDSPYRSGQRDFIYVKEVADAFIKAAESPKVGKGEVINIASGKVITIEELAKTFGTQIVYIPKRGFEVERHEADITRARELLGWEPKLEVLPWLKEYVKTL